MRNKSSSAAFAFVILVALISCKADQLSTVVNTRWKLVEMYGDDLSALQPPVTLTFGADQKSLSGHAPCNNFFGTYSSENSSITFTGLGSTKMYCGDKSAMEEKYLKALSSIQSFKLEDGNLYLLMGDRIVLKYKNTN